MTSPRPSSDGAAHARRPRDRERLRSHRAGGAPLLPIMHPRSRRHTVQQLCLCSAHATLNRCSLNANARCFIARSARQAKKAEDERQRNLVTLDLRGADHFPSELLAELPAAHPSGGSAEAADDAGATRRKKKRPRRDVAEDEEPPKRALQDGLPQARGAPSRCAAGARTGAAWPLAHRPHSIPGGTLPTCACVVRTEANVDVAVLPSRSTVPLAQAPVKVGLDDFLQKALYGRGVKRVRPSASRVRATRPESARACDAQTADGGCACGLPLSRRRRK
eukprot:6998757-Prymnesium_polylepis.1